MACSSCAANAARQRSAKVAKQPEEASFYGRYLSPDTGRFQLEPIVEESPEIICTYSKEELEVKKDELINLRKIETIKKKRLKITQNIMIIKDTLSHYDNNCLKNVTKLYEIFGY